MPENYESTEKADGSNRSAMFEANFLKGEGISPLLADQRADTNLVLTLVFEKIIDSSPERRLPARSSSYTCTNIWN